MNCYWRGLRPAGSGWRGESGSARPVCGMVAHFYFCLILILLTAFNSVSLPPFLPPPSHTYIHTNTLWFQTCWSLSEPASLAHRSLNPTWHNRPLLSNKHIRALRSAIKLRTGLWKLSCTEKWEACDNDIAGQENWMKRNKECDQGNGIPLQEHSTIFFLMGYLPEECNDNL